MGDFAWSMRDRSVGPMAQWYLSQINVPNLLFGLLMTSFPAMIGLFLGPIISVKSDRHRGKRGRRIPFLLITTPIAAIGMAGLAITPILSNWLHSQFPSQSPLMIATICFGLFWTLFEFATIAGQAVFGGLINDVVPAPLLGRFFGLFRAVSLIDGMIFNYWIYGKIPHHFTLILLIIAAFYGCAFMWVCFRVKEGEYPPLPPQSAAAGTSSFVTETKSYFRRCFSNPYYVSVFVMLVAANLTFLPVNTFAIPFARSLGVSEELYGKALALTFGISLCLAFFLGWLCDLFHPLRMTMICVAGYLAVTIFGTVYASTVNTFLAAWVLHGVFSGCFYSCVASLGLRLFPRSNYAQFASATGIIGSLTAMIVGPLMGMTLDLSGNVYRYTFLLGGIIALIALGASWVVYGKFIKLGGLKTYSAPASP